MLEYYPFLRLLKGHLRPFFGGLIALVAVDLINVGLPFIVKLAVDSLTKKNQPTVFLAAFLYFFLMCLQAYGRYLWRIYLIGTSHKVAEELRNQLLTHLQKLPVSYYQKMTTGDLMSRATNDVESVRMAIGPGILVAADVVVILGLIIPAMFFLSAKLTLLSLAFFPLVPFLTVKVGNRIDRLFESLQERLSHLSGFAQEIFSGIRILKSMVLENVALKRFQNLGEEYRKEGLRLAKYEAIFSPALSLITHAGTLFILWYGGLDVLAGVLSLGTLIAFQRFVVQLSWPMEAVGWAVTMNREGSAAYRRLQTVLQTPPVTDVHPANVSIPSKGIFIRNLHYSLPGSQLNLQIDHLEIRPGERVALIGRVGSGKSTLLNLLLRIYEPPAETIFLDGKDIRSISLSELRKRLASVEQQVILFGQTLKENVLLGSGKNTSIEEVLKKVALFEEVQNFKNGVNTILGERGVVLSGGQKQRVALARALYREPEYLILDDVFSAVDIPVEEEIIQSLLKTKREIGILLSTHRLSIAPYLDAIWFMEKGRVIATGTHEELWHNSQLYKEMYEKNLHEAQSSAEGVA